MNINDYRMDSIKINEDGYVDVEFIPFSRPKFRIRISKKNIGSLIRADCEYDDGMWELDIDSGIISKSMDDSKDIPLVELEITGQPLHFYGDRKK